ncbi:bark storage protein A-like isoform X1 [Tripterygium wilfordii]|uniref:Bark storage protein A-like isoform X1 n=1 Tax=Tripterygium wilfordii TaxID=458696 RepID=A0A7J7DA66_TRIWF|nr:5'-methylthioadenosine/S-adenosylhomocysteine nucleosidase [Tripterygium wilfordii]KAF5743252.1 bark storage protein A-like isoform X1 [Tripterygium wilfordii]
MEALRFIFRLSFALLVMVLHNKHHQANGALHSHTQLLVDEANNDGPYLGLVIPNLFEMNPLLQSPSFVSSNFYIDAYGRRFRFGTIGDKKVILVMTGLSMINAAITTQLLLGLFSIEGVVHYGIAGNANPSLNIGDVTIPKYWAHTALWNWQRYGQGPENELALESNGDYTRTVGYIKFANYTTNITGGSSFDNSLNNVWYQPEEVFPIDGTPEDREHAFWVPVDSNYFSISKKLEGLKLEACLNATTCLSDAPKVARVERGTSASIYLDNAAYRSFIYGKFNVSPVDMESASVALICYQQKVPFITIRALSDLAGGGSAHSNEADTFINLAANNSVTVVVAFIEQLSVSEALVASPPYISKMA